MWNTLSDFVEDSGSLVEKVISVKAFPLLDQFKNVRTR